MNSVCPTCGEAYDGPGCKRCLTEQATLAPANPTETLDPIPVAERTYEGRAVPGYEILSELGRGGMGVVYKARHLKLGRVVALKMILSGGHAAEGELARFRTEAEAIAKLQHPNVVQVFEVGEHEGLPYFSLEFCPGGSLDRKLAGTPQPPRQAAELVRTLALAMQAAHDAHVIHRDLKPANVLLGADGTPKITDFGLAKKLDEKGKTQTGAVMGTPSYMAPEQASGAKDVGPAADVYALGAILYECLVGRPPFKAATPFDTILQLLSEETAAPRSLVRNVPRDLETVALKCLEKPPARRYPSARALADDLGRFLADEPIEASRPGVAERLWRRARKQRQAMWTAGVGLILALALLVAGLGASAYHESQKGELELTTDGPSLTAEALRKDVLITRFRVPTVDPVRLDPGEYRLRLSAPGWPSEEANLLILPGGKHSFDANVLPRECWPAIEGTDRDSKNGLRPPIPVVSKDRTDLLQVRDTLVRVHGKTGKQTTLALPRGMTSLPLDTSWPDAFHHDLDGDGEADVFLVTAHGGIHLLRESPATELRAAAGSHLCAVVAVVPAQVKGHDLIVHLETGGQRHLERITGQGKRLWQVPSPVVSSPATYSSDDERLGTLKPRSGNVYSKGRPPHGVLGKWRGQAALVLATDSAIACVDPATGKTLWSDQTARQEMAPVFVDLDRDGDTDVLWVPARSGGRSEATAYLPSAARQAWARSDYYSILATMSAKAGEDVLLLTSGTNADGGWMAVERVSGRDGQTLWQARLVKGLNVFPHRIQSLHAIAGPDLDGDGEPEVFVAWVPDASGKNAPEAHLSALSGKDGRTLWYRHWAAGAYFKPLLLWAGGPGGRSRLIVPRGTQSASAAHVVTQGIDVLDCADGRLLHRIDNAASPLVADLDGDGLLDLSYLTFSRASGGREFLLDLDRGGATDTRTEEVRLRAIRGEPPTSWRWMGRWEQGHDLDGDGVPDVIRRERDGALAAASGATGERLWRAPLPPRAPGDGGEPRWLAGDTVLALPPGIGDLGDKPDGVPDLLVIDRPRKPATAAQKTQMLLPLRAVSGATGKTLWDADTPEMGAPLSLDPAGKQSVTLSGLTWLEAGGEPVIVLRAVATIQPSATKSYLLMLSARTGKAKWPRPQELSVGARHEVVLAKAGGRHLFAYLEMPFAQTSNRSLLLTIRDLRNGEEVGQQKVPAPAGMWLGLAPLPGKENAVLVRVGNAVHCIEAKAVKKQQPPQGQGRGVGSPHVLAGQGKEAQPDPIEVALAWKHEEPDQWASVNDWRPPVSLLVGDRRLIVYGASTAQGFTLVALDERGKVVARRPIVNEGATPKLHVANLAGAETLLVVSATRIRAFPSGIEAEAWAWPRTGREDGLSLRDASGSTVTVYSPRDQKLVGLSAAKGEVAWTSDTRGGTAQPEPGERPEVVLSWPGRQTVRQATNVPEPETRSYKQPPDDPRTSRRLPWATPDYEMTGVRWAVAGLMVFLALVGLVIPCRLFYRATSPFSWRKLLLLAVLLAAVALGVLFLGPEVAHLLGTPGDLMPVWMKAGFLALAGLPLVQVAWSLVVTLRRRNGWRLLRLGALWLGSCLLIGAAMLYLDRQALDEEQHYVFDHWYRLWTFGVYLASVPLMVGTLVRGLWRDKQGKKRTKPTPATTQ